jgi:large subunit ribosomal protein L15
MKLKKTKKSRRMRGYRLHGKSAKKHKGKGSKGGKGMSGSGKRADQKKSFVLKYDKEYFGKKVRTKKKKKQINVGDIQKNYKAGEVDLSNYKILGGGEIKDKFNIKARSFSKKAREKIEKAGGKAIEE